MLARLAVRERIPFCLSTMATRAPEDLAEDIGDQGWFQLYPPGDPEILSDMLTRIRGAGFHTLVLTVDVPVASRRERQTRAGLTHPPRLTPRLLAQDRAMPRLGAGHAAPRHAADAPFVGNMPEQTRCPRPRISATCCGCRPTGIT